MPFPDPATVIAPEFAAQPGLARIAEDTDNPGVYYSLRMQPNQPNAGQVAAKLADASGQPVTDGPAWAWAQACAVEVATLWFP